MSNWTIYGILLFSLGVAWGAIWNHYDVLLGSKGIKPTKWRGDDRIFGSVGLILFILFTVLFFTNH